MIFTGPSFNKGKNSDNPTNGPWRWYLPLKMLIEFKVFPINNWHTLIYYYYKNVTSSGHGINDDIFLIKKNLKTPTGDTLYKISIAHYLQIIQSVFGGEFEFNKDNLKNLEHIAMRVKKPGRYTSGLSQTPAFRIIERLVKGAKKWAKISLKK